MSTWLPFKPISLQRETGSQLPAGQSAKKNLVQTAVTAHWDGHSRRYGVGILNACFNSKSHETSQVYTICTLKLHKITRLACHCVRIHHDSSCPLFPPLGTSKSTPSEFSEYKDSFVEVTSERMTFRIFHIHQVGHRKMLVWIQHHVA